MVGRKLYSVAKSENQENFGREGQTASTPAPHVVLMTALAFAGIRPVAISSPSEDVILVSMSSEQAVKLASLLTEW